MSNFGTMRKPPQANPTDECVTTGSHHALAQHYTEPLRPSFTFVTMASVLIVSLSLLFFFSDPAWSKLGVVLRQVTITAFYIARRPWNTHTAFDLFANPHPVFTQSLDPTNLRKLLADRRRLRGGVFKNSLIAACSDNSAVLSTTLLSWNRLRHVRELIIVDYDSTTEGPITSLRLVDSIDKLGRVIYVTAGSRDATATPPKRIGRARAFNLGAAMASGTNLAIVDCNTRVSPWLLAEHPLTNRTFYTASIPRHASPPTVNPEYSLLYMTKRHFMQAGGFDERLDIPGSEFSDLSMRLRKTHRLRRLSMDNQMIRTLPQDRDESIVLARDSTLVDAGDVMESARRIPELSWYISSLAHRQLPPWNGSHTDGTGTMLQLKGMSFSVLRQQIESCRHDSRGKGRVQISSGSDYRLWVHVRIEGDESRFMLDLLPGATLHWVFLNAHRKLLHNEYMVPWDMLRILERHLWREGKRAEGVGGRERLGGVSGSQIGNYAPLLFDVVWRKKKLLVVNVEVEEAIELMVAVSWAIAYAVSKDRSLVLVGQLGEVGVAEALDYDGMMDILHREYNLKLSIFGGGDEWDCRRGNDEHCWSGDMAGKAWDEYNLTREPSGLRDNGNKHDLFNIVGSKIERWEGSEGSTGLQRRLQKLGFASVSVSREVGEGMGIGMSDGICEAGVVVGTGGDIDGEEVVGHVTGEVVRLAAESDNVTSMEGRYVYVSGGRLGTDEERAWEARQGGMNMLSGGKRERGDGVGKMGDLWRLLRCRRIGFTGGQGGGAWNGAEEGIMEWRRIHLGDDAETGAGVERSKVGTWEWMVFEGLVGDHGASNDLPARVKMSWDQSDAYFTTSPDSVRSAGDN